LFLVGGIAAEGDFGGEGVEEGDEVVEPFVALEFPRCGVDEVAVGAAEAFPGLGAGEDVLPLLDEGLQVLVGLHAVRLRLLLVVRGQVVSWMRAASRRGGIQA
jgi:hypothetical protein